MIIEEKKEILNKKAQAFFSLLINKGIGCSFNERLTDNNKTKINFKELGNAVLYYGKKGFTLTTNELKDEQLKDKIKKLWEEFQLDKYKKNNIQEINADNFSIYVDGSYLSPKEVGYGFVVVENNKIIYEENDNIDDASIIEHRQVGGEIQAVISALNWCKRNNISEVDIFYDYEGLKNWATNKWSTNKSVTRNYQNFVQNSGITINWIKVTAHTNDYWNDYVDKLAKEGAKNSRNKLDTTFMSKNDSVSLEEIENFKIFLEKEHFPYEGPKKLNDYQYRFEINIDNRKTFVDFWKNDKGKSAKHKFDTNMSSITKRKLEVFWENTFVDESVNDPFSSFEYYYNILKKYRECNFDFSILVSKLNSVAIKISEKELPFDSPFEKIETYYNYLRSKINETIK